MDQMASTTPNKGDNYFNRKGMDTINERMTMSYQKSNSENENSLNKSGGRSNDIDRSVRDPDRPVEYVSGLTDFLIDEYFRRYGIYSSDDKQLLNFWRENIQANSLKSRLSTTTKKMKTTYTSGFDMDVEDLLKTADILGGGRSNSKSTFEPMFESKIPELPGEGFGAKYKKQGKKREQSVKKLASHFKFTATKPGQQYAHLSECDVANTVYKDLEQRATERRMKEMARQEALTKR